MIETVLAVQFDRLAASGRTKPAFLTCENMSGDPVEVVAKLSAQCDLRETALAMELFCALVGAELGLPLPEPFLVQLDPAFIDTIVDADWAAAARRGPKLAFGSKRVPPGFSTWIFGTPLLGEMVQTAAGAFLFDAIADNPDRRDTNPNCLVRGPELRLIDHELCFAAVPLFGWQPPWRIGSLQHLERQGAHIFRAGLLRHQIDWMAIKDAWARLSDERLNEYAATLPNAWTAARPAVDAAVQRLHEARDHIEGCIIEVRRLLT